jgi:hypothetical protein
MSSCYTLWDLIDIGRADLPRFLKILDELTEQELVDFYWQHGDAMTHLYEASLNAHMGEWASDNTLEWLAEWIVDQGNDYWNDVLEDMSVAPQRFPRDKEVGLRRLAQTAYRRRFGDYVRFPDEAPRQPAT